MPGVIAIFESYPERIFVRIALHVLAKKPDVAPELAEKYLRNPDLIDGQWCAEEYAELAIAWFPSLGAGKQQTVLDLVDAVPDRYRTGWEQRFVEHYNRSPNTEVAAPGMRLITVRDILWRWRAVLPAERLEAIANAAAEFGDPDAWKVPFWGQGKAGIPVAWADLAAQSVEATFAFISAWKPGEEPQKQTLTALHLGVAQSRGTRPG